MTRKPDKSSVRDRYIAEQYRKGFTPSQIRVLLEAEGFRVVSRIRILQIVEAEGKKKK